MHFCCGQCSFVEHRNYKIVYRRYASLFFLVGVDDGEVIFLFIFLRLNWFIVHTKTVKILLQTNNINIKCLIIVLNYLSKIMPSKVIYPLRLKWKLHLSKETETIFCCKLWNLKLLVSLNICNFSKTFHLIVRSTFHG